MITIQSIFNTWFTFDPYVSNVSLSYKLVNVSSSPAAQAYFFACSQTVKRLLLLYIEHIERIMASHNSPMFTDFLLDNLFNLNIFFNSMVLLNFFKLHVILNTRVVILTAHYYFFSPHSPSRTFEPFKAATKIFHHSLSGI